MPALSFNYFDRLVLKNVVNKGNRRAVAGVGLFAAQTAIRCVIRHNQPAGACLLLAIKISDDFFVGSRIFQAAASASHDDAKRICQISSTARVAQEPFYEIVFIPPFRFCLRAL
jgi:hypothetical protein